MPGPLVPACMEMRLYPVVLLDPTVRVQFQEALAPAMATDLLGATHLSLRLRLGKAQVRLVDAVLSHQIRPANLTVA